MEKLSKFCNKVKRDKKKLDPHKEKLKSVREKDFNRQSWQPKYATYTFLTKIPTCILEEAFNIKILALPSPTNSHSQVDHTKQCRYHRNYGHPTKEFIVLKGKSEKLVQKGCLNDFIRGINYN